MNARGPSTDLSWKELGCHDAAATPYPGEWLDRALALASEFEAIREACSRDLGRTAVIRVISGYRTLARNAAVGGAGKSQRTEGRALDLAPPVGMGLERFAEIVLAQARRREIIRGVGVYQNDGHVHFDIRLGNALAFWKE